MKFFNLPAELFSNQNILTALNPMNYTLAVEILKMKPVALVRAKLLQISSLSMFIIFEDNIEKKTMRKPESRKVVSRVQGRPKVVVGAK